MTDWVFNPLKYGARGDGVKDDIDALDRAYAAAVVCAVGGEGAEVVSMPGKQYGISRKWVLNRHASQIDFHMARIIALSGFSSSIAVSMERDTVVGGFSEDEQWYNYVQRMIIDANNQACDGLANVDGFRSTAGEDIMKSCRYQHVVLRNIAAGRNGVYFRNAENGTVFDGIYVEGLSSSAGTPSYGVRYEDDQHNGGNTYFQNMKLSSSTSGSNHTLFSAQAVDSPLNRIYASHIHCFGGNGSTNVTALKFRATDGGGMLNNRGWQLHHLDAEDTKIGLDISADAGSGVWFDINHVQLENKNNGAARYESGNQLVNIGTRVAGNISNLNMMIKSSSTNTNEVYGGINCDSDDDVTITNWRLFDRETTHPTGYALNKVTGAALDNNPPTLHLGEMVMLAGFMPQVTPSSGQKRYIPIGGHEYTGLSSEGPVQIKAKKKMVLRMLTCKPQSNALGNSTPVRFRRNGTNVLSVTLSAGSAAEQAAVAPAYQEIAYDDLINFLVDFSTSPQETGSLRIANVTAWCEQLEEIIS